MFNELHAMAKAATLLITASAEGDQLRVSVTPTYPDGKVPAGAALLRPLSVIGTPDELEADFTTALTIWRAPKRSIIEQAQAAADDEPDDNAGGKAAAKPAADKSAKARPSRKPTAAAAPKADSAGQGAAESTDVAGSSSDSAAGALGGDEEASNSGAAPAEPPAAEPAPAAEAVKDRFTIDLF